MIIKRNKKKVANRLKMPARRLGVGLVLVLGIYMLVFPGSLRAGESRRGQKPPGLETIAGTGHQGPV